MQNNSLGKVLRELKSRSSSSCSSEAAEGIHKLYKDFDTGYISNSEFCKQLQEDFALQLNPDFNKVLTDPNRTYFRLLKSLGLSRKTYSKEKPYFSNPHSSRLIKTTQLTTLPSQAPKHQDLYKAIRKYLSGKVSSEQFTEFLSLKQVPLTQEISRIIREKDSSNNCDFSKLGKAIFNAMNPAQELVLVSEELPKSKLSNSQINQELIRQELNTLVPGIPLTHKKRCKPPASDNGNILNPPSQPLSCRHKHLSHLQHTNIFS